MITEIKIHHPEAEKKETLESFKFQAGVMRSKFFDDVPKNRITHNSKDFPKYPYYMVQESFFRGVRDLMIRISTSGYFPENQFFSESALEIEEMLKNRKRMAYGGINGENFGNLSEDIRNQFVYKLAKGKSVDDAINKVINELTGERRVDV